MTITRYQLISETKTRGGRAWSFDSINLSTSPGRAHTVIIAISFAHRAAAGWPVLTHSCDHASHVTLICSFCSDVAAAVHLCREMSLLQRTRATVVHLRSFDLDPISQDSSTFSVVYDSSSIFFYCDHPGLWCEVSNSPGLLYGLL
jgi:hypothetical protein